MEVLQRVLRSSSAKRGCLLEPHVLPGSANFFYVVGRPEMVPFHLLPHERGPNTEPSSYVADGELKRLGQEGQRQ